jgi:hypothetical protein
LLLLVKCTRPDISERTIENQTQSWWKTHDGCYRLFCYLLQTQHYLSIVFSTHQSASDDVKKWRYWSIKFSHNINQWRV